MNRRTALVAPLALALLALAGCAPGAATGGSGTGGGSGSGGGLDCSGATTAGYELFVDPRLTVDPKLDVYPLGSASDSIAFTDVPENGEYTTYSYSRSYLDGGTVFPNGGAIFAGAEDTNTFTLTGPVGATGISGGPYAAFIDIEATTGTGTTVIARLCAVLAAG